jgi:hypothetical protein
MRMPSALRFPALVKFSHTDFEALPFLLKIALIRDQQFLVCRIVLREGLFIGVDWLDERPKQPANEHPLRIDLSRSHIHGRGTMGKHLRHVHLSPPPLERGLQRVDARDHFVDCLWLE